MLAAEAIFEAVKPKGFVSVIVLNTSVGCRALAERNAQGESILEKLAISNDPAWRLFPSWPQKLEPLVANPLLPVIVIIEGADRFVNPAHGASEEVFAFFVAMERLLYCAKLLRRPNGESQIWKPYFNSIIWMLKGTARLPAWYGHGNELFRQLDISLPDRLHRLKAAKTLGLDVPEQQLAAFVDSTRGFSILAMQQTARIAKDVHGAALGDSLEGAVQTYRLGVLNNPWQQPHLRESLRSAEATLSSRVIGQPHAIARSLDIIKRSVLGLTGAHAGVRALRPRGVLFFAGPTGVGKTELAKALTELIFRDETAYIRFDMSEFAAEHSDQRLIGAPPSYIGFEAGGELTNAIRRNPFSLLLFDEIEKAHPRILDKFLQILEDGRLTDGRGETVYFSECLIVFTSNLGVVASTEDGTGSILSHSLPFDELRSRVLSAIQNHFIFRLGRPELLNRLGDNIEVFDFIRPEVGRLILDAMLEKIRLRVQAELKWTIDITPSIGRIRELCLSDLVNGGRGIGNKLETHLVNPLSRLFFDRPPPINSSVYIILLAGDQVSWEFKA